MVTIKIEPGNLFCKSIRLKIDTHNNKVVCEPSQKNAIQCNASRNVIDCDFLETAICALNTTVTTGTLGLTPESLASSRDNVSKYTYHCQHMTIIYYCKQCINDDCFSTGRMLRLNGYAPGQQGLKEARHPT